MPSPTPAAAAVASLGAALVLLDTALGAMCAPACAGVHVVFDPSAAAAAGCGVFGIPAAAPGPSAAFAAPAAAAGGWLSIPAPTPAAPGAAASRGTSCAPTSCGVTGDSLTSAPLLAADTKCRYGGLC